MSVTGSEQDFKEFKDGVVRALEKFEAKLDNMAEDVKEVRECQIRHEAHFNGESHKKIMEEQEKLVARVAVLEAASHKQGGMLLALEWIYKLGPWFLVTGVAVFSWWKGLL